MDMAIDFDFKRARRDTPGCENRVHFNNAGAALMPAPVINAVIDHLNLEGQIGGYEAAEQEHDTIERVYAAAASLIGASRDEIAIVENATRAWDMAFYGIPFRSGDRVLTSVSEYGSNFIAFLQVAARTGAIIDVIPNDDYGQVSIAALREMIDERVKLIAITHVPTNGGLVNPVAAIGRIAREANVRFLLDACQSVGQLPINVEEICCDILSATGRKYLRGPRGTGFLYVRKELIDSLEPPFLDVRSARWIARDKYDIRHDARRFENWETNYSTKIGLGVAIEYALEWGIEIIRERIITLAETLRARLMSLNDVIVRDLGLERCGIVSFTVTGIEPEEIKHQLAAESINVSVSVLRDTLLDMQTREIKSMVRASVHYYNSEDEIRRFCSVLASILHHEHK